MKLLRVLIIILLFTAIPLTGISNELEERLLLVEKKLWNANEQIKADKVEIEDLYEEIERLVLENETLKVEKYSLEAYYKKELKKHTGFYLGTNFGLPLINVDAIVMYKFNRIGIYLIGGYNQQANVGLGIMVKVP